METIMRLKVVDSTEVEKPRCLSIEKWLSKTITVGDKGFVRLVDYMGDDAAIVQAARVSYGAGTKTKREDKFRICHGHS